MPALRTLSRLLAEGIEPRPGRRYWHGGPSVVGALRGVTVEHALWRPGPRRTCIWELGLHIAYWNDAVRCRIDPRSPRDFDRRPANWPRLPATPDAKAWREDQARIAEAHRRLAEAAAQVSPVHYHRRPPGANKWTYGELILGIGQHDAYHTGQIQLLKRLVRGRK